ncbi:MAG: dockerin type I domain-containing protein [Candidatus Zixiibacteriota bacterium]
MKRNLLLLAVMILTVFAFSSLYAQCPQAPNDNGICDTLTMSVWPADANFPLPTGYAKISLYVSHDTPNPVDSIAGFIIPLCFTHSNPSKFCSLTTYQNEIAWTTAKLPRSIFRHLPDNATATVHNWMQDLYTAGNGEEWNGIILDLDGVSHFRLALIRSGPEDKRYGETTKRLTATMSFKLQDSMTVCIDTCFWPPSSRLAFIRSDAVGYIPRMSWKDDQGAGTFCHNFFIIPHLPPQLTCPGTQNHNTNGSFSTEGSAIVHDSATISSATATFTGSGVTGMSIFAGAPIGDSVPIYISYDVINHCAAGGSVKVIVTDSQGAKDTCFFGITLRNSPPSITCPNNGSVHAGNVLISTNFSVADSGGDYAPVTLLSITPPATNNPSIVFTHLEWNTTCAENGDYTISLLATDPCGATDTCQFMVNVYNQPPVLTCPHGDSINAGDHFVSSDYSVTDADDPTGVAVTLSSVSPTPSQTPFIVGNHIEWNTSCADLVNGPNFIFTLIATDPCGAKDTCQFTVTVYNLPPVITCPENDSIHAGNNFVSTDFSTSDPKAELVTVSLCGITPAPVNQPSIIQNHIEWQTACADVGKIFTICLVTEDNCGARDTCHFDVTVYNQPPQLTCPVNGSVHAGHMFTSTNFSVADLDGDTAPVTFLSMTPPATNNPTMVGSHVEWNTTCAENGNYTISLLATDPCGAKDTCQFTVNVYYNQPPEIIDSLDTVFVRNQTRFKYYPSIIDPDDSVHVISYPTYPHWCVVENDSVVGIAPDTSFRENLEVVVQDPCNADTLAFLVFVYLCGDCNADGVVNAGDVVWLINYLFKNGPPPKPYAAGNCDGKGVVDVSDVVFLINYLFKGGPAPHC